MVSAPAPPVRMLSRLEPVIDTPCAAPDGPVGGLTVLRFSNNHLVYALTWFALAAMTVAATVFVLRDGARRRLPGQSGASS